MTHASASRRGALLVWTLAAALFASTAQAQQPGTVSSADSARRADSIRAATHKLGEVVVTGTRLSTVDENIPSQVEQLELDKSIPGPEGITNALTRLPGVSLYDDQGARLQPELEIRGFSVSSIVGTPQGIGVFLNGIRVNEPDAQEVDFDLLPMAAIDKSSLDRGSNVLFGRNSLGGTLLMTTKRGSDTPEASAEVGGGSFGEQIATVTAGGKLGGIDGFIAATGENEIGWKNFSSGNTRNLFATIGHQWGPSHDSGDVALDVQYGLDRIYEVGSLPIAYNAINPRYDYSGGDFFNPDALDADLRGNALGFGGIFRGTIFGRRNNVNQFNGNVPPPNSDGFTDNLTGGGTLEWTRPIFIGTVPIGLTVGTEYSRESSHIRLLNVGGGAPDSVTTLATIHQDNAAVYAQAVVTVIPRMNVTGGLRYDYVHIPFRDGLDADNDGTSTYNQLSPEIGLTYQFTDEFRGYAAYKEGFRAPAPLELACASPVAPCSLPSALGADPTLKPVSTHDWEAGIDYDFSARTTLDIDGFWTDVYNDIVFASPNRTQVFYVNAPHTRRAGIEASGQVGLPAGFYVAGSYSYVAATFQSSLLISTADTNPQPTKPGDIFPTSPLHRGRVAAGLSRLIGPVLFDGEFDIKGYQGQYLRGDESNQRPELPGYTVAGLRGHIDYRNYGVELDIENLFNRQYYTFGIEAQNSLIPIYSQVPLNDNDSPVVPFVVPAMPRRITLTFSVHTP
jgi:iron complex outermembrane receptor protein